MASSESRSWCFELNVNNDSQLFMWSVKRKPKKTKHENYPPTAWLIWSQNFYSFCLHCQKNWTEERLREVIFLKALSNNSEFMWPFLVWGIVCRMFARIKHKIIRKKIAMLADRLGASEREPNVIAPYGVWKVNRQRRTQARKQGVRNIQCYIRITLHLSVVTAMLMYLQYTVIPDIIIAFKSYYFSEENMF